MKWRALTTERLVILFAALLFLGQYKLRPWQEANARDFADDQTAELAIDNGLLDSQLTERIFPSPEFVAHNVPDLRRSGLSVFSRGHEKWLGRNASQFGKMKTLPIPGEIVSTFPVEHGVGLVGWADLPDPRNRWPWILLVNERGQIAGFGRRLPAGFPMALQSVKIPEKEGWVGFVNLAVPCQTISAYVVRRRDLDPIQGAVPIPALQTASANETGTALKDIAWHMDSSWRPNGVPLPPRFGLFPAVSIFSSVGDKPGQIVASFAAPPGACVLLPVLHSDASIAGAAAQLIDADTGNVLAVLPFRKHDVLWSVWRVFLNSNVKHLRFVATDTHEEAGQWLAVSAPLECK
jgi:hypothetical protein